KKINVSRVTIRSSLSDLEREGKILRYQGKGTFINNNFQNMKVDLFRMKSYSQIIKESGYKLNIKSLESKLSETPKFIKRKTNYKKDKIVVSSRIYYADNKFSALCVDYLPIQYEKDIE